MGEAINLVYNFKVEKVIFNCGEYNDLEKELIKVLDKKNIKYYSCISELNIDKNKFALIEDLDKYKLYDPDYYNQLTYMFPDVEASSRYSKDISVDKVAENYGNNPEGMVKYILEHIDESVKRKYLNDLKRVLIKRNNYLKEEKLLPFGGYPFIRIWLWLIYGNGLIEVVNYRLKDFLFEGFTERDYQKYEIDRRGG